MRKLWMRKYGYGLMILVRDNPMPYTKDEKKWCSWQKKNPEGTELSDWDYKTIHPNDETETELFSTPRQKFGLFLTANLDREEETGLLLAYGNRFPDVISFKPRDTIDCDLEYLPRNCYLTLKGFLEEFNVSVEDFIFDPKYIVLYDPKHSMDDLMASGLLNYDALEGIYTYTDAAYYLRGLCKPEDVGNWDQILGAEEEDEEDGRD